MWSLQMMQHGIQHKILAPSTDASSNPIYLISQAWKNVRSLFSEMMMLNWSNLFCAKQVNDDSTKHSCFYNNHFKKVIQIFCVALIGDQPCFNLLLKCHFLPKWWDHVNSCGDVKHKEFLSTAGTPWIIKCL